MSGLSEYEELMAKWASAYMKPLLDEHGKGTLIEPEKHISFNTIFYGFSEITSTLDALKLSEVLISVAPPRSTRINNDEYIKYLINTYLQDMYILKERLNAYATKLKRLYNRTGRNQLVSEHIGPLFEIVKSSLDGIVTVRGAHVHSNRYSDDKLDDVSQMALISRFDPEFEPHFKHSYTKAKNSWASTIANNNQTLKKLLDYYFSELINVVKENDSVYMP